MNLHIYFLFKIINEFNQIKIQEASLNKKPERKQHMRAPPFGMYRHDVELPNIWSAPCGREGWKEGGMEGGRERGVEEQKGGSECEEQNARGCNVCLQTLTEAFPLRSVPSSVVSERENLTSSRCSFASSGQTANQSRCLRFICNTVTPPLTHSPLLFFFF